MSLNGKEVSTGSEGRTLSLCGRPKWTECLWLSLRRARYGRIAGPSLNRPLALCAVALLPPVIFFCPVVLPVMPGPRAASAVVGLFPLLLPFVLFFLLLGYLAVGIALAVGSFMRPKGERRAARWLALTLLCGFAAFLLLSKPTWALRMWFVRQLASRTQPLIAALEAFKEDRGRYPPSLEALVPNYLARVPGTGMMGDPDFRYTRVDPADELGGGPGDPAPGYHLSVGCTWAFLQLDSMHYRPSRDYPERGWGGTIEEIDGWAYVHE